MATGTIEASSDVVNGWYIHAGSGLYQAIRGDVSCYAYSDVGALGIVEFNDITGTPAGHGISVFSCALSYSNTNGSASQASIVDTTGAVLATTSLGTTGFDYIYDYSDPVTYPTGRLVSVNAHYNTVTLAYTPPRPVSVGVASLWRLQLEQTTDAQFAEFNHSPVTWTSAVLPVKTHQFIL